MATEVINVPGGDYFINSSQTYSPNYEVREVPGAGLLVAPQLAAPPSSGDAIVMAMVMT